MQMSNKKRIEFIILLGISLLFVSACSSFASSPEPKTQVIARTVQDNRQDDEHEKYTAPASTYRNRRGIPIGSSRYEGSLWRNEASWGNLLIDHRARFKNDVLTINNIQKIIEVPDDTATPDAASKTERNINAIADTLGLYDHQKEQNGVLRKIKTLSAKVDRVLPNGNLIVVAKKIDYRRDNQIRYITMLRGMIRQKDIDENNTVDATKLAFSEVKIRRQVLERSLNLQGLSPIIGRKNAGILGASQRALSDQNGSTNLNTR